tara:strand:+ start:9369 stop:10706 length:1338 start_codon:yes stop_codon:yes gene_type:complete
MSNKSAILRFFKSSLVRYFFFQIFASIWSKLISLLIIPILANFLGPENFGKIDYFFIIVSLVSIILCFEIFQTISPYLLGQIENKNSKKILSSIKIIFPFWSFLIILVSLFIIEYFQVFDESIRKWWIPTLVLVSLSNLTLEYFRWSGLPKLFTISFVAQSTTMFLLSLYIIYNNLISTLSFILITNLSYSVVIFVGIYHLLQKINKKSLLNSKKLDNKISFDLLFSYFRNSGILTLSIYSQLFAISIDRIITGTFSNNEELLGELSYSYRLAWGAASIILFSLQITMQPWAIKILNNTNTDRLPDNIIFKNRVIGTYLILILVGFFFSSNILNFWYFDFLFKNYNLSRELIPWHFVSIMLFNIQICQPQLIAKHQYIRIFFSYSSSIILIIFLSLFFEIEVIMTLVLASLISSFFILLLSKTERIYILLHLFISFILISYYFLV